MNTALKAAIVIAAATAGTSSHAVIVVDYEFNDPAGAFSTAVNTGSGAIATWGADADATLNGAGQLAVTGPLGFQARLLSPADAISSGSAFLRIDFDSWGTAADPFFVFGLRGSGPNTAGNQSWRLQFSSGDADDNDPPGRVFEVTNNSLNNGFNSLAGGIPAAGVPGGMSFIMGMNLDADTTSVWWDLGRTGNYVIAGGRENVPISIANASKDFNLVDAIQLQSNGGPFAIDRLVLGTSFAEIAAIPEPSLVAVFGALSFALATSMRRRSARPL